MATNEKKGGFTSGIGFVLASAGSAVGLGNLWGFPYKTSTNGGAAFVFVYIACVLLLGAITMICEVFIGKRAQANPISAFKKANKNMGWVGLVAIVVPTIIVCYYSVLGGYTVKYTVNSLVGNSGNLSNFASTDWEVILFTAIFVIFALIVVMGGIKNGIEKASKIMMPVLFVMLLAVVVFVLCLGEGVSEGLVFYLVPDFSKITFSSVLAAMGQAFYSLSLGMGAMIVYGSYTGKEINLVKSTGMICIFDTIVALLAGLAIFPAIGHFASEAGFSILDAEAMKASGLNLEGIMLMFETLPRVFESIGFVGKIFELIFFGMVTIAAVTSVISIMEVASQFIIQKFRISRKITTAIIALITFSVAIPVGLSLGRLLGGAGGMTVFGMDYLTFLDTITNTVLMPVCAFLSCITVGWIIGTKKSLSEIKSEGVSFGKLEGIVAVMIKFITPVLIGLIEVFGIIDLVFPEGVFSANGLGVAIVSYALVGVLVAIYFALLKNTDTGSNETELLQP